MTDYDSTCPPSPARLSKTPSWVLLGFLAGAVVVGSWRMDSGKKEKPIPTPAPPPVRLERPQATEIEAVFAEWGRFAIWENDLTEVAMWDRDKHGFSQFFEVLRSGDAYYFRTIPQLTRPMLPQSADPRAPLLFTETEEARRERLRQSGVNLGGGRGL